EGFLNIIRRRGLLPGLEASVLKLTASLRPEQQEAAIAQIKQELEQAGGPEEQEAILREAERVAQEFKKGNEEIRRAERQQLQQIEARQRTLLRILESAFPTLESLAAPEVLAGLGERVTALFAKFGREVPEALRRQLQALTEQSVA